MARGGKRKNSGRKKGQLSEVRKAELEALARFKERVAKRVDELFNVQMDKAIGEKHLICLDASTASAYKVTDLKVILDFYNGKLNKKGSKKYYSITTKDSDTKTVDSLLDRAFGKAAQSLAINPELDLNKIIEKLDDEYNPEELEEV
jgi:hypothetical protein